MSPHVKNLFVEHNNSPTGDALAVEIVERKGIGHPDTICDEIAEAVSRSLQKYYLSEFGKVFHYNVDKVLLRAGTSHAEYGGGSIESPIEVYVCGRATTEVSGKSVPIGDLCDTSARAWIRSNLRYLDVERDLRIINLIRPGSADLTALFERDGQGHVAKSNDTSIGLGYSPLSWLERAVLEADKLLRSSALQREMPFVGEDIKIMAVRNRGDVRITLACATVSRFIHDLPDYIDKKAALSKRLREHLNLFGLPNVEVLVNAADNLEKGSVYLTVTGTSAEAGDDGEVGRGNRANGLITPCRPMTIEAFAGKNSISHTGRIYQFWSQAIADQLGANVSELSSVECMMVSQIGAPINEPQIISVRCTLGPGREYVAGLESKCEPVVEAVMASTGPQ